MTFVMVGTPGDRRPALFAQACRSCGLPEPRLIAWTDVLHGADLALGPGDVLRIDSPGEDPAADALLRGPGDPSRVGGGARWYSTFVAALHRIEDAAARAGARLLGDIDEIAVMFDKRRSHARMAAAGVPVPKSLPRVQSYKELRAHMDELGERRVFVKPAHSSSASGVVALQTAPDDRVRAVTSAAISETGLSNSLRVRAYETERDVAALIDALVPDGLQVERWLPKAALGGSVFDLRVVVLGGTPTHVVVRTSRGPMTNLHLGGARGDLAAVRRALGRDGWLRALDVCARAAACFPRSPMVGVDLLVLQGMRRFAVCEVNAFGDLLPGLTGLPGGPAEGLDTYTAQVRAALPEIAPACTT
ncbi:STM4014 family protein [Actinomadura verrucosospora]|uniref:Glutathione synthase/ribosomal protein S6 modification enzyme Glutaminyl transferase n=1 Tax=Actinomadura verrucosospora TaxID=46165 RepID=A0A7D3VS76_ACTVE|nr:STM4014 family protein [Actinomadura verrucosospora]QKG21159.1 Glutathione synthase/ribosomal protein S6 modification enzyme Glutaminyl transferase [Actinomadura verrucosospora]